MSGCARRLLLCSCGTSKVHLMNSLKGRSSSQQGNEIRWLFYLGFVIVGYLVLTLLVLVSPFVHCFFFITSTDALVLLDVVLHSFIIYSFIYIHAYCYITALLNPPLSRSVVFGSRSYVTDHAKDFPMGISHSPSVALRAWTYSPSCLSESTGNFLHSRK